ncbi:MAG: hypothetical protein A3D92_23215 [Bacteroidetes bacterium RIFCSPHIGHO2_02_FULL_44_7]|nr:MAG: hypothetical protein A3D92_23215 [Bacteroidetes bacterium RIFCSPHIGHO2_02_FULL_44_7]
MCCLQSNFGVDYSTALKTAQELGFAEADPTLDVDGFDSKFKLVLLIKHAFGLSVTPEQIHNIGIRGISEREIAFAAEKGYRIKLLSRAEKIGNEVLGIVAPYYVSREHPAYEVNNEFNAVIVEALFSDRQLFLGKGAGSYPTASAVLSDVSALKFDYRYEYRKSILPNDLKFSDDVLVHAYIASTDSDLLETIDFEEIEEQFRSKTYAYKTGLISFQLLAALNVNERNDLCVVLLPGAIVQRKVALEHASAYELN